jgi:hypothetical protein
VQRVRSVALPTHSTELSAAPPAASLDQARGDPFAAKPEEEAGMTVVNANLAIPDKASSRRIELDPVRMGLVFGVFATFLHSGWLLVVATTFGQPLLDLAFGLHFIAPAYSVTGFDVPTAVALLCSGFIGGALLGFVFALIWNSVAPVRR